MIKAHTPDSSPEEQQQMMNGVKDLMQLFKTNPKAAALLKEAQAGNLSEDQFLLELMKLDVTGAL